MIFIRRPLAALASDPKETNLQFEKLQIFLMGLISLEGRSGSAARFLRFILARGIAP
jgi:hypothetical protein